MQNFNEQLYEMIGRCRQIQTRSKAAAAVVTPCQMIVSDNPDWDRGNKSKAASTQTQYQTVVKKYDMDGSSTGEMIYLCGVHDFETKSLKEFNEHVTRLPHDDSGGSGKAAAASVPGINKLKAIHDFISSNMILFVLLIISEVDLLFLC
jgi:hypothetical protein